MNTAFGVKVILGLLLTPLVLMPAESVVVSNQSLITETITVSVSGDLLVHHSLYEQALRVGGGVRYDFTAQLAPVKKLLTADVNICHLETPLTTGEPKTYPVFATPDSLAKAIAKTGWDGCSLASNHSLDLGELGVYHTILAMQSAGLITSGTRDRQQKRGELDPAIGWYELDQDIQLAHLSYSWSTNGIKPKHSWLVNSPISTETILKDARKAKQYGADLVIVSIHAGTEYVATPNNQQKSISREIMKSPNVDAMVGHHAHVVQDAELINGKPVIYGLGNFWSGQGKWSDQSSSQSGALVTLKFSRLAGDSNMGSGEFRYAGIQVDTVFTTPEGWMVLPADQISISSRWGAAAGKAISMHRFLLRGLFLQKRENR